LKNGQLILLVVLLGLTVLAATVPVTGAQSTNKPPKQMYWWCWASQLNAPNKPARYYSNVFSGPYTRSQLDTAFRVYLHKAYLQDEQAGGIGPGQCGSYTTKDLAQNSLDRMVNATEDTFNSRPVTTGWVYGANANTKLFYCMSAGTCNVMTSAFRASVADHDRIQREWHDWLAGNLQCAQGPVFPSGGCSDPFDTQQDVEYQRSIRTDYRTINWLPSEAIGHGK
jgi:hypothetical protein